MGSMFSRKTWMRFKHKIVFKAAFKHFNKPNANATCAAEEVKVKW